MPCLESFGQVREVDSKCMNCKTYSKTMSGSHTFSKNVWYDLPTKYHTQNDIKHLMLYIRITT